MNKNTSKQYKQALDKLEIKCKSINLNTTKCTVHLPKLTLTPFINQADELAITATAEFIVLVSENTYYKQ